MADNRDVLAGMLAAGQTGGLTPGDFTTFANKLNNPDALKGWYDAGGIFGQNGGTPPDPDEQYFAMKPRPSGSGDEMNWMNALQPWQGGQSGALPGSGINTSGFIGGGSQTRADPAYWGWMGPHQGYAPGSMGDISGFNNNRGGGAGGTGGLTPQDFATFSRLVSPQALQEWLNAGGVQGQFGGGMGGAVGGGGGTGGGGGQGPSSGQGPGAGGGRGGGNTIGDVALGYNDAAGLNPSTAPNIGLFGDVAGGRGFNGASQGIDWGGDTAMGEGWGGVGAAPY